MGGDNLEKKYARNTVKTGNAKRDLQLKRIQKDMARIKVLVDFLKAS